MFEWLKYLCQGEVNALNGGRKYAIENMYHCSVGMRVWHSTRGMGTVRKRVRDRDLDPRLTIQFDGDRSIHRYDSVSMSKRKLYGFSFSKEDIDQTTPVQKVVPTQKTEANTVLEMQTLIAEQKQEIQRLQTTLTAVRNLVRGAKGDLTPQADIATSKRELSEQNILTQ